MYVRYSAFTTPSRQEGCLLPRKCWEQLVSWRESSINSLLSIVCVRNRKSKNSPQENEHSHHKHNQYTNSRAIREGHCLANLIHRCWKHPSETRHGMILFLEGEEEMKPSHPNSGSDSSLRFQYPLPAIMSTSARIATVFNADTRSFRSEMCSWFLCSSRVVDSSILSARPF